MFSVTYKDNMYIFGGYNGELRRHFNDLYKFSYGNVLEIIIINLKSIIHLLSKLIQSRSENFIQYYYFLKVELF